MNFDFDCEKLLGCDSYGIAIIEPSHKSYIKIYNYLAMCKIINAIGSLSSLVIII